MSALPLICSLSARFSPGTSQRPLRYTEHNNQDTWRWQARAGIDPAAGFRSRFVFTPETAGVYRVIATSFHAKKTGSYSLVVNRKQPLDGDKLSFTKVKDSNKGRMSALESGTWERKKK